MYVINTLILFPSLLQVTQTPEKDLLLNSKREMLASIDVCMGGRVAEELVLGVDSVTSGASSDLAKATHIANDMVVRYGMSESVSSKSLVLLPAMSCG